MFSFPQSFYAVYNLMPVAMRNATASVYSYWSAKKKYGGRYREWRDFLARSQWMGADELRRYQSKQAEELLAFVAGECPFYRRIIEERRILADGPPPLEALKRFPLLTKMTVRENYDSIKTRFAGNARLVLSTSGTTGTSLHVPMTAATFQREYAFRWQFQSVAGAQRGSRFAYFTGHSTVPVGRKRPPFHIRNYAENSIMFSLYHMADRTMASYVEALNAFRPDYISGYPSGIFVLASFASRRGLRLASPKAVFCASEMLHDAQKEIIESVFGAPVYQWFGQVETTVNIHECEKRRLHVKEEYGWLEILREDGSEARPGEPGKAVGTGFGNPAFPLIRYETGDQMILAAEPRCPCGRGGRIIEKILGRDEDFLITPDGRYIGRLDFVFKPVDSVLESQIVQEDADHVVVRVVPLANFSDRDVVLIQRKLRDRIGDSMSIRVETVQSLPRTPSGKVRYVVSRVAGQMRGADHASSPAISKDR